MSLNGSKLKRCPITGTASGNNTICSPLYASGTQLVAEVVLSNLSPLPVRITFQSNLTALSGPIMIAGSSTLVLPMHVGGHCRPTLSSQNLNMIQSGSQSLEGIISVLQGFSGSRL